MKEYNDSKGISNLYNPYASTGQLAPLFDTIDRQTISDKLNTKLNAGGGTT